MFYIKNKSKLSSLILLSMLTLFLSSKFTAYSENDNHIIKKLDKGEVDWTDKTIRVKGHGLLPESGALPQKRLKARVAARADAYRNIAEILNGVQVTSETTVVNFVTQSDVIKVKVDAVVKGARQIGDEIQKEDGSFEVEFYVPIFGNSSVANALDLGNFIKKKETTDYSLFGYYIASLKDFYTPNKYKNSITLENSGNITGLIVDATSFGVEPAMSPFMVAGGKIVYAGGKVTVDPDNIIKYGVTDYAKSLDIAKQNISRVGKYPMIVEAKGAVGKPSRTNILLDDITVKEILSANEKFKFLNNLSVVVVI